MKKIIIILAMVAAVLAIPAPAQAANCGTGQRYGSFHRFTFHDHNHRTTAPLWARRCYDSSGRDYVQVYKLGAGYNVYGDHINCSYSLPAVYFREFRAVFKFSDGRSVELTVPCDTDTAAKVRRRVDMRFYSSDICPVWPCWAAAVVDRKHIMNYAITSDPTYSTGNRLIAPPV